MLTSYAGLRCSAYLIAFVLALGWVARGLASLELPLFDFGTNDTGGAIIAIATALDLGPAATFQLAYLLAGLKVLIGAYLLAGVAVGIADLMIEGRSDDALLDVMLMIGAVASAIAALAAVPDATTWIRIHLGEVFLCLIASMLAALSRALQPVAEAKVRATLADPIIPRV